MCFAVRLIVVDATASLTTSAKVRHATWAQQICRQAELTPLAETSDWTDTYSAGIMAMVMSVYTAMMSQLSMGHMMAAGSSTACPEHILKR